MLLGVTTLSIKLPSLILGVLSFVGILILLKNWLKENVAVIAALIVITSSQFIFTSQDGTPTIMYVFFSTWLLVFALKVSRKINQRSFWEFLLMTTLVLSLYTPLSIYIIIALASATILHPHLRYIVVRLSRKKLLAAGTIGLVLLAPLILAIVTKPDIGLRLLGIPESEIDVRNNLTDLSGTFFNFGWPGASDYPRSRYTLPTLLLMLLGVVQLFQTRYTARSYIITSWILLLTPIILINPERTIITFVPLMLLIAAGIDVLLRRWYSLFPRNPYARVAGLVPITILVAGMALVGIERYFYAYRYSPPIASQFTNDLSLLHQELNELDSKEITLLVTKPELSFYQAVAEHRDGLSVTVSGLSSDVDQTVIATRAAFYEGSAGSIQPSQIITNGKSSDSDRLYLYKSTDK